MIIQGNGSELLGPKGPGETRTARFDFSDEAASAASLVSASATATWAGGTYDPNPAAVLAGSASIDDFTVLQAFTGGQQGAVYKITVTATDSNAETHTITAQLVVEPAESYATWGDFAPMVLDHAKEAPIFLIEQHVADAADEFCRQSHAWRSPNGPMLTTIAGVSIYQLPAQANGEVMAIHAAWAEGAEVRVCLPGAADDTDPASSSMRWSLGLEYGSLVRLTPTPQQGGVVVTGSVSYAPARWALGIPMPLFQRWGREIAYGAAARLTSQGGKPWSDPKASSMLAGQFMAGVLEASNEAGPVQRGRNRLRVVPA
jgi:hypothetical protein